MKAKNGFTLIELMIVIAIIAIIAAIAIPGLLQSQRASNERNASASLKTLATAEADFRANDRDGNHVNDFWTNDVCSLYSIFPPGAGANPAAIVKLVEISVAGADAYASAIIAGPAATPYGTIQITNYAVPQPKSGYWYYAMVSDASQGGGAPPYKVSTDGGTAYHNNSQFGFGAYPDSFNSGRNIFIINEGNTIFKRSCIAICNPAPANRPPGAGPLTTGVNNGGDDPNIWPTDGNLKNDYSKMD